MTAIIGSYYDLIKSIIRLMCIGQHSDWLHFRWDEESLKRRLETVRLLQGRLLDTAGEEFEQGINARQYRSLAKVSKAAATRDLADLLDKGCLARLPGGGRSTRYTIALDLTDQGQEAE